MSIEGSWRFHQAQSRISESNSPKIDPKSKSKLTIDHPVTNKTVIAAQKKIFKSESKEFIQLDHGAAKIVLKDKDVENPKFVYYIPVDNLLNFKEKELRSEVTTMNDILNKFKNANGGSHPQYLFVEVDVIEGAEKIESKYTLKVKAAQSNFEKRIQSNIDPENRGKLLGNFIKGLEELHSTGYAYGDIKPENCLTFEKKVIDEETGSETTELSLKWGDFGKARSMNPGDAPIYEGNPRFGPPEGFLTKKGDIFGAGMVLLRALEQEFLTADKPSLLLVKEPQFKHEKTFVGIEKFLVDNKNFHACPSGGLASLHHRFRTIVSSDQRKREQAISIKKYISALSDHLKTKYDNTQVDQITNLIEDMMNIDPTKRPTAKQATERFQSIGILRQK
ncbi:MAG: hypothetical protein VX777_10555 [Chlamydiota bacterium]|nr:hypothetical protein [Chlamydiota bacterium]